MSDLEPRRNIKNKVKGEGVWRALRMEGQKRYGYGGGLVGAVPWARCVDGGRDLQLHSQTVFRFRKKLSLNDNTLDA